MHCFYPAILATVSAASRKRYSLDRWRSTAHSNAAALHQLQSPGSAANSSAMADHSQGAAFTRSATVPAAASFDPSESEASDNELSRTFSRISLGAAKRQYKSPYAAFSAESEEGAPQQIFERQPEKRRDMNETPFAIKSLAAMSRGAELEDAAHELLVLCPEVCVEHKTVQDHQENERRIDVLAGAAGCLFREPFQGKLHWVQSSAIKPASLVDVLRVHEWEYIRHLQQVCDESSRHQGDQKSKRGWSKLVPPVTEKAGFAPDVGYLDIDTIVSPASVNAARHAAGAAIHAVDLLAERRMRKDALVPTAFVVCRPPGHHAGARGCVPAAGYWRRPDMTSSGFCLINNVGIAAAYARCHSSRTTFSKIAIIDFDIHHGNGTEDIVKNLRPREQFFPLPGSWAPMKYETFKPWLNEDDSENVFFASINLFEGDNFYPGSGSGADDNRRSYPNVLNIGLSPVGPAPGDLRARTKLSEAQRAQYCQLASTELRTKTQEQLLPALRAFQPDLIILSSGFDGHADDYYHFFTEDDYYWLTSEFCEIARASNACVLSVLEGGYNLDPPSRPAPKAPPKSKSRSRGQPAPVADGAASPGGEPKYAIEPTDGGLAKGVLGHICALLDATASTGRRAARPPSAGASQPLTAYRNAHRTPEKLPDPSSLLDNMSPFPSAPPPAFQAHAWSKFNNQRM